MKGNKLLLALALALIVCLVLIPTCAFAEDTSTPVPPPAASAPPAVTIGKDASATAFESDANVTEADGTYTLSDDVDLNEKRIYVDAGEGNAITIDLGGHTISNGESFSQGTRSLTINSGNVTINNGTIVGRVDVYGGSSLTIGSDAAVDGSVVVWSAQGEGTNPTLDVYGTVSNNNGVNKTNAISTNGLDDGTATINIHEGAKVEMNGDTAIYLPSGNLNVSGGEITGATAIYVKGGSLNVTGGTITGNGEKKDVTVLGDGNDPTGDAIVIQYLHDDANYVPGKNGYAPIATPNISGGTINSENGAAVLTNKAPASTQEADEGFITGGTFKGTVDEKLVSASSDMVVGADGTVTVKAKPAVGAYAVVEGNGAEWTKGSKDGLKFMLSSGKVVMVLVDGAEVEFEVAEDGTVTISADVLEALEAGTHTIQFVFIDGTCGATFTVK